MKKVIALALTTTLLLTGCGKEEAKPDQTVEQLMARIGQLEEENKKLKEELGQNTDNSIEPISNEHPEEVQATQQDESTTGETPATENSSNETPEEDYSQYIKSEAGNTQQGHYITFDNGQVELIQTADSFTYKDQNTDKTILLIPMKFTNKSDEPKHPFADFSHTTYVNQENSTQVMDLMTDMVILPKEYEHQFKGELKPGVSIDVYFPITLDNTEYDVKINNIISRETIYTLKFQ